ncbi:MAG: HAMP domain-containing protein [Spirochaetaceae bacterium]|nr:HAMP domain-containing protein [Spirochaetaceae bacterium]
MTLSLGAFLLVAFFASARLLRAYALRTADALASTVLDQTDKRLEQFFKDMEFLALGLAGSRPVREADPEAMRDLFLSTVRARRAYLRAVYLGTADGRMFEWGEGAGFVDNKPSFHAGYDPRLRPWYQAAVSERGFSISAPYQFASVDALGISCVLPLAASGGGVAGVLGLDILLDDLAGMLDELEIPLAGKALILGADGSVVASQLPGDRGGALSLKRFDLAGGEGILRERAGSFKAMVAGGETHFVHKRARRPDWIIAVAMPLDSIMEPVRALLALINALDLALLAVFITALVGITNRLIVSPLHHIVAVVDRIEGGERGARVAVRSRDEFGLLGEELNKLVAAAEEHSRCLEEQVARRTEEILLLQRENTQLKVIEERQRIYRDLHDSIGAKLTNVFFCDGVARDLAKGLPGAGTPGDGERVRQLKEMLDGIEANCLLAIRDLKEIVLGLRDADRPGGDFPRSLAAAVRRRLKTKGIGFDCRVEGREEFRSLDTEVRDELEKIFDELVSNVLKHSGAKRVRLRMRAAGGRLSLRFADDGGGFEPGAAGAAVSGLANIRYRVERLGGSASVESAPGRGSVHTMELPLGTGAA